MVSRRWFGGALVGAVVLLCFSQRNQKAHAGPRIHHIAIRQFAFIPVVIEIQSGDAVEWKNHDIAPHTATERDQIWETVGLAQGESGQVQFTEPGRIVYHCAYHPHMTGEIIVA